MQTSTEFTIDLTQGRAPDAGHPPATVLVIDDSKLNRHVLSDLLRENGHRVVAVSEAAGALDLLASRTIDLVLLDLILPGMNGSELLAQISSRWPAVPVIVVTGVDRIDATARCIELGAADYLLKPIEPVLLQARIGACLEQRWLRLREAEYLARIQEENKRCP